MEKFVQLEQDLQKFLVTVQPIIKIVVSSSEGSKNPGLILAKALKDMLSDSKLFKRMEEILPPLFSKYEHLLDPEFKPTEHQLTRIQEGPESVDEMESDLKYFLNTIKPVIDLLENKSGRSAIFLLNKIRKELKGKWDEFKALGPQLQPLLVKYQYLIHGNRI